MFNNVCNIQSAHHVYQERSTLSITFQITPDNHNGSYRLLTDNTGIYKNKKRLIQMIWT